MARRAQPLFDLFKIHDSSAGRIRWRDAVHRFCASLRWPFVKAQAGMELRRRGQWNASPQPGRPSRVHHEMAGFWSKAEVLESVCRRSKQGKPGDDCWRVESPVGLNANSGETNAT